MPAPWYSVPWAKMTQQKFNNGIAVLRLYRRAPARHLIYFTLPLGTGEFLAGDHILPMTSNAGAFYLRWKCGRRRCLLDSRLSWGGAHFDAYLRHDVPQVTRGIPFLDQRLRFPSLVGGARHENMRACSPGTPVGFPKPPAVSGSVGPKLGRPPLP